MATIKEVALKANCSISTVSYALNGDKRISLATTQRVKLAAEELGYFPTSAARALKKKRNDLVCVFTYGYAGPVFSELLTSISDYLVKYGYDMITTSNYETASKFIREHSIDGAISIDFNINETSILEAEKNNIPIFLLNSTSTNKNTYVYIQDNKNLFYSLTELLISKNCKHIIYLSGPPNSYDDDERKAGYEMACQNSGLTPMVVSSAFTIESGYNSAKQILLSKMKFDAIACGNDEMAIGVLEAFREVNILAPKDILIVGYDNNELSRYYTPRLTTASVDRNAWGKLVVENLVKVIDGHKVEREVTIKGSVHVREST